jgi:hypothetical protein
MSKRFFPGQKIRVYTTNFCKEKPNDLYLDTYFDGIVTRVEHFVGPFYHVHFKVTRCVLSGKNTPRSWTVTTERSFSDDAHYVKIISHQLAINL